VLHRGRIVRELDRADLTREGGSEKVFVKLCGAAEHRGIDADGAS
jgi:hypothetical protein